MPKVQRFSQKMLYNIENLKTRGHSIQQIARKLDITPTDVKNGLDKIYDEEWKHEIS